MTTKTTTIKHPSVEEPCKGAKATAQARKRRMELRKKMRAAASASAKEEEAEPTVLLVEQPGFPPSKRLKKNRLEGEEETTAGGEEASLAASEEQQQHQDEEEKPKPSITGIKKQHRYDPGVKMTREELKAWRKEARRVRNRESAAASRKRNRERITELEEEVRAITSKYGAALRHILRMEEGHAHAPVPSALRQDLRESAFSSSPCSASSPEGDTTRPLSPDTSLQDSMAQMVSPPLSPASSDACSSALHNPMLLRAVTSMDPLPPEHPYRYLPVLSSVSPSPPPSPQHEGQEGHYDEDDPLVNSKITTTKYQHIMDMISRPVVSI